MRARRDCQGSGGPPPTHTTALTAPKYYLSLCAGPDYVLDPCKAQIFQAQDRSQGSAWDSRDRWSNYKLSPSFDLQT